MVEEVTTEAAARRVAHEMFGHPIAPHDRFGGSYYHEISATTKAISDATGKSEVDSFRHLQDAALTFKSRQFALDRESDVVHAFASDIAHHTGVPAHIIEPHLLKAIDEVANANATENGQLK